MQSLEQVKQRQLCIGCGLCVATPQAMHTTVSGFYEPAVTQNTPANRAACPGLGSQRSHQEHEHPIWGPIKSSITTWAEQPKVRYTGASGGALTALLSYCLEHEEIDGVLLTGAHPENPLANKTYLATTPEQVQQYSGSRYAPSSPLDHVQKLRGNNQRYAIVARPCDIAALRTLAALQPDIAQQYPIMLSFMCAGVPSQQGSRQMLTHMGIDADAPLKQLWYRGRGWPGQATAVLPDNTQRALDYHQAWGTILNQYLHPRCKLCADGTGEQADLIAADGWHQNQTGQPSFEEAPGRSLVLARTTTGQRLLDKARQAGYLNAGEHYPVADIGAIQRHQQQRKRTMFARYLALKLTARPTPVFKGYGLGRLAMTQPTTQLRTFIGALKRRFQGRL